MIAVKAYIIMFFFFFLPRQLVVDGNSSSVELHGLPPATEYRVYLTARSPHYESDPSNSTTFTTQPLPEGAPDFLLA